MSNYFKLLAVTVIILMIAGCGGGGGASNTAKVTAVMKTAALSQAAATVGAISATIVFPAGVYVATDANGIPVVSQVVQILHATLPLGTVISIPDYLPATTTQSGSLRITILNADGFNATEDIAVTLEVRNGFQPKATDFSLTGFAAWDLNGADVTNTLSPSLTASVQ